MPAALLVALSVRDTELMHRVFDRVVDNGGVLRTVFQMTRSGQFKNNVGKGRVGLSNSVQRAFQRWLNTASVGKVLSASIGNDPSLRDMILGQLTPKVAHKAALNCFCCFDQRQKNCASRSHRSTKPERDRR
jgi:60 kDa SS-A/Ro ribonucleoprotein